MDSHIPGIFRVPGSSCRDTPLTVYRQSSLVTAGDLSNPPIVAVNDMRRSIRDDLRTFGVKSRVFREGIERNEIKLKQKQRRMESVEEQPRDDIMDNIMKFKVERNRPEEFSTLKHSTMLEFNEAELVDFNARTIEMLDTKEAKVTQRRDSMALEGMLNDMLASVRNRNEDHRRKRKKRLNQFAKLSHKVMKTTWATSLFKKPPENFGGDQAADNLSERENASVKRLPGLRRAGTILTSRSSGRGEQFEFMKLVTLKLATTQRDSTSSQPGSPSGSRPGSRPDSKKATLRHRKSDANNLLTRVQSSKLQKRTSSQLQRDPSSQLQLPGVQNDHTEFPGSQPKALRVPSLGRMSTFKLDIRAPVSLNSPTAPAPSISVALSPNPRLRSMIMKHQIRGSLHQRPAQKIEHNPDLVHLFNRSMEILEDSENIPSEFAKIVRTTKKVRKLKPRSSSMLEMSIRIEKPVVVMESPGMFLK
eukprot:101567_1